VVRLELTLALPWSIEINGSKIFFIAIPFYSNIVGQNVSCDVGLSDQKVLADGSILIIFGLFFTT
jgi:hypothetical protein